MTDYEKSPLTTIYHIIVVIKSDDNASKIRVVFDSSTLNSNG